jgi:hypothetical protein
MVWQAAIGATVGAAITGGPVVVDWLNNNFAINWNYTALSLAASAVGYVGDKNGWKVDTTGYDAGEGYRQNKLQDATYGVNVKDYYDSHDGPPINHRLDTVSAGESEYDRNYNPDIHYESGLEEVPGPITYGILGGSAAIRLASGVMESRTFFGRGGVLNSNRYLRVGWGRNNGREVFRISGDAVGFFKKNPHIDLWKGSRY